VAEIFYNFPDPWPKRRHHKKRLFTSDFLDTLSRVMKDDAVFTCATDDKDYLLWMLDCLENDARFVHSFEEKVVNNLEGYHNTLFEKMWREMGKEIYYYRFIKS
jgi:tRNA (guanine-N7-)-methyltransferase